MEEAFAAGTPPVGIGATAQAGGHPGRIRGCRPRARRQAAQDVESIESPAVADRRAAALAAAASNGTGEAAPAVEPEGGEAPEGPASGNGHDASTGAEGEAGPEPVNGGAGGEDPPADPSVADAIEAMNAIPTADGGPRVIVRTVGPVNGHEAGDDPLEIPEFLRRVH